MRKRSINKSKFHGWGLFRHYIALLVVFVVLVSPVFLPLLGAFKSSGDPIYGKGATAFPQHWSLNAFGELFRTTDIVRYIANLFAVCGLNIVSALVFSSVCGYMLSRKGWPGRGVVTAVALSALIFPFESIMLSLYSQVRSFGFYDTIIGIWPPGMIGPFHVLLMRAAFLGIPDEIEDAAYPADTSAGHDGLFLIPARSRAAGINEIMGRGYDVGLLREGFDAGTSYFVDEEEVPPTGTRLTLAYHRTRWRDGRPVVWLGIRRGTGHGERSSGLAFDLTVPQ